jgi:tetraacyldisaccharide 4'-kinase
LLTSSGLDAHYLLGNGRILPAGPLREPFSTALVRADAIVTVAPPGDYGHIPPQPPHAPSEQVLREALGLLGHPMPLIRAALVPQPEAAAAIAGLRVLPFSGIARPWRFFDTLRSLGCDVVDEYPLPDHAPISANMLDRMRRAAESHGAILSTTVKDAARLSEDDRRSVSVLPMQLHWQPGAVEQIDELLMPLLRQIPVSLST